MNSNSDILLKKIGITLKAMIKMERGSISDPRFIALLYTLFTQYDEYQAAALQQEAFISRCDRGCSLCCRHWVENVYSFEAEMINNFIRRRFPDELPDLAALFAYDLREFTRLAALTRTHIEQEQARGNEAPADEEFIILSSFYQLGHPCPFLDNTGGCMVYEVRPLICRMYVNVKDPAYCDPDTILSSDNRSLFLIDLDDTVNKLLEKLHRRYLVFPGDRGLRSIMAAYLKDCGEDS